MRTRILRFIAVPAALAASLTAVSCGGGGGGVDMVLVGFNLPNIAGVPINQPLIYTFSDNVDPSTVTPDTLQVVGQPSFTFETIVVDGNLVAELPSIPTFDDYSDSGMAPNTTYNVFLPVFPAVDTVKSTTGRPLVKAESFTFQTFPAPLFIEARRPLVHTPGPVSGSAGARGDEDGCLQNPTNTLYDPNNPFQAGTDAFARLLCLQNDGAPQVLLDQCSPTHDQRAVGTPSATAPGTLDLGAIRIRFNEPLDPLTVTPFVQPLAANVQLYRVADANLIPLPVPVQVPTNIPVVVQDLSKTEVILVPVGPQPQGIYAVNVKSIKDLAGNFLNPNTRPNPIPAGYGPVDTYLNGRIPIGYRYYFRTLELPATDGSVTEGFGNNFAELTHDLFTFTTVPSVPTSPIVGSPLLALTNTFTLVQTEPGQSTNANWNGTNRFLGLPDVRLNTLVDDGAGRLKAVFKPYLGTGEDGVFNLTAGSATLSSDTGSFDNDGVFEFESFNLGTGASLTLTGSKPVLILVRGSCTIAGTITGSGTEGRFGIDTDGTVRYTNLTAISAPSGLGGSPGPGAGAGGHGAPVKTGVTPGTATDGGLGLNLFGEGDLAGPGTRGATADVNNQGGGGAGYGTAGSGGSGALNGSVAGEATFARALSLFVPERSHQPNANVAGGSGGGGGGLEDDNGANETGDGMVTFLGTGQVTSGEDCGAGGGGGGGGVWIIADTLTVTGTGVIRCDGGRGGNTYGPAEQVLIDPTPVPNPDNPPSYTDEYINGVVNQNAAGTGAGGGGGGGAGGAILLQARTSLAVQASATLSAVGGAAGTAASKNGGLGGDGRIGLMGFAASGDDAVPATVTIDGGAVITPAAGVQGQLWKPSTDLTSQGVSQWINLVTSTTTFGVPFWDDNTVTLTGAGLTTPADFSITLEFQGADSLTPDSVNPTAGTGLTAWSTSAASLNNKLFFRWRFRFFVAKTFNEATFPMPQVLNITIPFQK